MDDGSTTRTVGLAAGVSAVALGGAYVGGLAGVGLVSVALGAVFAWRFREPHHASPADVHEPTPAPPAATPEPAPEPEPAGLDDARAPGEESVSGLVPLPIEPTEARDLDSLGQVWRSTLDACIDGLLIVGPDDRVLYANPAIGRIVGTSEIDLLGVGIEELFPDLDEQDNSTAGFRRTGSEVLGIEWRAEGLRSDGQRFPAEVTINPLSDAGMGVYQVRDISDRVADEERTRKVNDVLEKLRNQALEASKSKSAFLANMSHELRTPLNAILGYSEMLSEELSDEASLGDVRKIRSAGRHLMSLINTILDLSKIEAGRMELFMETLSVDILVRELSNLAEPLAEENGNTFTVDVDDGVGRMVADQVKLRQVLLNVLGNAFKFTEAGEVHLSVRRSTTNDADWVHFEVRDTGIGIPREQHNQIFEEFDQGDMSTSRRFGGSGLGLSISRRFCRMMGGDITLKSTEGEGSVFTVKLPANTVEGEATTGASADASVRVLVIDDDPGVRELMARTLAGSGYQVLTASTGEQGLRRAKSFRPHVITLDVMMPGMDGWEVLGRLKEEPTLRAVPVVMVSMVDERRKGYALGATAYLTKPLDRGQLIDLVSAFQGDEPLDVLIVDDDDDVRDLVRRTLSTSGTIEVREAQDGAEALERMRDQRPGLVLLDLMMPGMDGFELLDAMASDPDLGEVAVAVLSALDLTSEQRLQLESRVELVLEKGSCSQEELLRLVRAKVSAHARAGGS